MSYIGKNPKVDSVKLDGSATVPTGTSVEGQVYYNTGTGSISKGLKVYKNSQFVSIDKQLGDADTFHLLKASDLAVSEWSAARNSTSTSFINQNAVPFETTTASGAAGTFSNTSTGDALLTDESADLVFAYKSSGSSDDAQEYFGIPLTVPKAFRGGNIVLSFEYRTGYGTGTTATVDGDFEVGILDKSTGNGGQTTSTNSTTDITAGSAITVASKTGLAVGQRIRLEAGSQSTIGNPDATVVEAYITEVSSTANEIKISKDWDTPHASGAVVVSGWLTDVVPGQLPAADSQTNKQGKKFSIQFKTEDDTSDIVLFFQNKNTSSTISRHLFVDNILLSANKFLQASSQTKSECYIQGDIANFWDGTGTAIYTFDASLLDPQNGATPVLADSKLITVADQTSGTNTVTAIKAKQNIVLDVNAFGELTADYVLGIYNSSDSRITGNQHNSTGAMNAVSINIALDKDDYIYFATHPSTRDGGMVITATPQASPVVILESQDEIFSDWTEFDATLSTATGTAPSGFTTAKGRWRRVGSCMDIAYTFVGSSTTVTGTGVYLGNLPSGYSIDMGQIQGTVAGDLTSQNPGLQGFAFFDDTTNHSWYQPLIYSSTQFYMNGAYHGGNNQPGTGASGPAFGSTDKSLIISLTNVPIQGWNSNFNPLLSMPLVDLGQPVESWNAQWQADFMDASTANTYTWDFSMLGRYPNPTTGTVGTIGDSNLITVADRTSGTNTVTAITAKQDIVLYAIMQNELPNTGLARWYDSNDDVIVQSSVNGANASGLFPVQVNLKTGDYIYFWNENPYTRQGGITITAQKIMSGNMAHIIKPAVASIRQVKGKGSDGGTISSFTYVDRECNVFEGETWFVTPGTGTLGSGGTCVSFTLEAGTYETSIEGCARECNTNFLRLYNNTDSTVTIQGRNSFSDSTTNNAMPVSSAKGVFTITSAKEFKIQHYAQSTKSASGQGLGIGTGSTNNPDTSIHMEAIFRKLK